MKKNIFIILLFVFVFTGLLFTQDKNILSAIDILAAINSKNDVAFENCIVKDSLIFKNIDIKGSISFKNCEFLEQIIIENSIIENTIFLHKIQVKKDIIISNSKILGKIFITDSEFMESFSIENSFLKESLAFVDNVFHKKFTINNCRLSCYIINLCNSEFKEGYVFSKSNIETVKDGIVSIFFISDEEEKIKKYMDNYEFAEITVDKVSFKNNKENTQNVEVTNDSNEANSDGTGKEKGYKGVVKQNGDCRGCCSTHNGVDCSVGPDEDDSVICKDGHRKSSCKFTNCCE